jgi:hypothetical protein
VVSCLNIAWIYTWGNEYCVPAAVILFVFDIVFYITIGLQFNHFYKVKDKINKVDTFLTYALPMNGLCFYATWTTIAALINLTAAVQTTTSISNVNMATVSITLLLLFLVGYFVLESTVLDKYGFRYVYSVYPVPIWALAGVLVAHWDDKGDFRNNVYTLVVLAVTVVLFALKLVPQAWRLMVGSARQTSKQSFIRME